MLYVRRPASSAKMELPRAMAFASLPPPGYPRLTRSTFTSTCVRCHPPKQVKSSITMRSKRERRSKSRGSTPSNSNSSPSPPRVDVESSTLSLRAQLKLARLNAPPSPPPKRERTSFRRKKNDTMASGRRRRSEDASLPDGKYEMEADPVLYIDAYNVIGAWARLKKARDKGDLAMARDLLMHDVAEFSHVRGWDCVVVFDAQGNDEVTRVSRTEQDIEVVYTGTETADTFIERKVYEDCEKGGRQVWAATSDVAQLSFSRAKGAHVMSSTLFVQELKRARKETRELVQLTDENAARARMFIGSVDPDTVKGLYELRDRLNGS